MKTAIKLILVTTGLFYILTFHGCGYGNGCDEWRDYPSVTYDTFNLIDSNIIWKYNTSWKSVVFVDSSNNKYFFFKPFHSYKGYDRCNVEFFPMDEENCTNAGYNYIECEWEREEWLSPDIPLEIRFYRHAVSSGESKFNPDSVQNSYLGEICKVEFSHPFGKFEIPDSDPPQYIKHNIEKLDTVTLNGKLWQNVIHVYYTKSPIYSTPQYYINGVYIKWGIGLICFYDIKGKYWYLEI